MRVVPPPLSVTLPPPSITVSCSMLCSDVTVMVIGAGPQSNVTTPPLASAAWSAPSVHPPGTPWPTTALGDDVSTGWIGAGPSVVVTDLGVYGFDDATGEMCLASLHPGVKLRDVQDSTGWELSVPDDVGFTEPPTADELRLVREELDPEGVYTR